MPCIANGRLREKRGLWEFSSTKCDFWELFGKLRVPECRQFWFWWNRLSWDCYYWAQPSDPSQSLILSNSMIYHLNLECCLQRRLMRLKTKNTLRNLEIYVLLKCRAIMVERAPETGVDPLMKFSSQKNTFPPGAQSSTWRHKQSPKELGVLPENLPQLQKIECSLPFLEWSMISHVNMNFHLQNKYRLQFWMKLYLAAWVARFGNIFPQILEFQSSSGVIQKVTGTLQSDILCFQNSVFPPWCFWNKWLWAWHEKRQFCDFSWLIDRGRPKISI